MSFITGRDEHSVRPSVILLCFLYAWPWSIASVTHSLSGHLIVHAKRSKLRHVLPPIECD